jgi:hypothetical protein
MTMSVIFKIFFLVDYLFYHVRNEEDNKVVRKNISIPRWLNAKAKENKINCSLLLASAIREKLGI